MSYTINLTNLQAKQVINQYQEQQVPHTNNYTLFRAKHKTATITIFKTLTMIIQGSGCRDVYQEICSLLHLEQENVEEKSKTVEVNLSVIGTDEVGTGDFFGPIVVAGAFVPKNKILLLMRLGIRDSKQMSDERIKHLAPKLIQELKHSVLVLDNIKYNYLTRIQHYNMNKLKALLHNNVINNLLHKVEGYDQIIIDAFTTREKYFEYLQDEKKVIENVELVEKGESKYIAVAAASVIARYYFLQELEKLSKDVGFDLPKGAGSKVDLAISKILKDQSERYLDVISKTNFKNLEKTKRKDSH
jgi:ribonuclease HIII